jgi:hypothetical protein
MKTEQRIAAMPRIMPYVVRGPVDLRMLLRPRAILKPFDKPQVLVRIPELTAEEAQTWERRLAPLTHECGCGTGAATLGIYLLAVMAVAAFANVPDDLRQPLATYLVWGGGFFAGLFASAMLGKTFGQGLAAYQLWRTCVALEKLLAERRVVVNDGVEDGDLMAVGS